MVYLSHCSVSNTVKYYIIYNRKFPYIVATGVLYPSIRRQFKGGLGVDAPVEKKMLRIEEMLKYALALLN